MRKQLIPVTRIGVLVALLGFYLWLPGSAPAGQQPLVKLAHGDITQFRAAFDRDADVPRVVLLLSPT